MNSIYQKAQDRDKKLTNNYAFLSHLSMGTSNDSSTISKKGKSPDNTVKKGSTLMEKTKAAKQARERKIIAETLTEAIRAVDGLRSHNIIWRTTERDRFNMIKITTYYGNK